LFSFGVIADIQYADIDDGWDYHKTAERHYRNSLTVLKNAIQDWKNKGEISFIAQLGDLLDGINRRTKASEESLKLLVDQFLDFKVHHLVGNHELYNFRRSELKNKLCNGYYHFSPHPHWRFILLDAFEFCTIQAETKELALEYLSQYNPNQMEKSVDWKKGLVGLNQRFVPFNGSVTNEQLIWLNEVLDEAIKEGQKVIILSHVPIGPGSCSPHCLLWNYDKVLEIIYSKSNCVKAILAGHDHKGGFIRDEHGIYHCTFKAALEAPIGQNAHCTIEVYSEKLIIKGNGIISDDIWMI
jgi:manganese-dependent ADP-ribose/CDP-alcohol diphosphatase